MAQNTLEIVAKVKADTAEASRQLQQLMQQFKGFKLTDSGLTSQIERSFAKLDKAIANTNQTADQIAGGKATVAQLNAMTKASEQTRKAFSELQQALARVGAKQLDVDLNSQEILDARKLATSAEQAVKRAQEKLKTSLEGLSLPSKINNKLFSGLLNAVDSGDIGKIKATYDKLGNELVTKIKDINNKVAEEESKRIANKTKYESQESSLNSITKEIKKYQEAEKELSKFSFKSFSESLTNITKGTGIVKLKTSLNAVNESFGNIGKGGSIETAIQALQRLQQQYNSMSMPPQMSTEQWTQLGTAINSALSESGNITQYVQKLNDAKQALENLTKGLGTNFTQDFTNKITGLIKNDKIDELSTTIAEKLASVQSQLSKVGDGTDASGLKAQATALKDFQDALNTLINTGSLDALRQLQKTWADAKINVGNKENNAIQEAIRQFLNLRGAVDGAADAYRGASMASDAATDSIVRQKQELGQVISRFAQFGTMAGIIRTFTRVVRSAFQSVKELDEAMNNIAVVTNYTTKDLWDQIDAYTAMAQATGSTIKGSYEVAQLYYQQGLTDAEVMAATNETLKMARISNIEYSKATDYATAAIKGFGLAYQDLAHVNDVYSNLAAKTAASTEEISIAMSKVASIAHSTGMELETTAAFLTQIIATTREAPETAGTALKTVIARFAEVKKLISKGELTGTDEEGTEIDVNNIETALKTAGVALRDTTGQMRDLDDVFIELASRWDSLDTMQQRYIATQAAGSRQQSRFLAMMNDYAGLQEVLGYAMDSEGASQEQFNKTLDSLASKLNNLSNAWTRFSTGIMNSDFIKGAVDILTDMLNIINDITGSLGSKGSSISKGLLMISALRYGTGAAGSLLGKLGVDIPQNFPNLTNVWQTGLFGRVTNAFGAVSARKQGIRDKISELQEEYDIWNADEDKSDDVVQEMGAIKGQIDSLTGSLSSGKEGFKSFWKALGTGGQVMLIIAAITAVIAILDKCIVTSKEATRAWENMQSSLKETQDTIKEYQNQLDVIDTIQQGYIAFDKQGKKIEESSKSLDQLLAGVNSYGDNLSLSNEEYIEFQNLSSQIIELFPELKSGYDSVTEAIGAQKDKTKELLEQQKQELEWEQRDTATNFVKEYFTSIGVGEDNKLKVTQQHYDDLNKELGYKQDEQLIGTFKANDRMLLMNISDFLTDDVKALLGESVQKELFLSTYDSTTGQVSYDTDSVDAYDVSKLLANESQVFESLKSSYLEKVFGPLEEGLEYSEEQIAEAEKAARENLRDWKNTSRDTTKEISSITQQITDMENKHREALYMEAQTYDGWYELDGKTQKIIKNIIKNDEQFTLSVSNGNSEHYLDYLDQQTQVGDIVESFQNMDNLKMSTGLLKGKNIKSVLELYMSGDSSNFSSWADYTKFMQDTPQQMLQSYIDAINDPKVDASLKENYKKIIGTLFSDNSYSEIDGKYYIKPGSVTPKFAPSTQPKRISYSDKIAQDWGTKWSQYVDDKTPDELAGSVAQTLNNMDPAVVQRILDDYAAGLEIDWDAVVNNDGGLEGALERQYSDYSYDNLYHANMPANKEWAEGQPGYEQWAVQQGVSGGQPGNTVTFMDTQGIQVTQEYGIAANKTATSLEDLTDATRQLTQDAWQAIDAQSNLSNTIANNSKKYREAKKSGKTYAKELGEITKAAQGVFGKSIDADFVEENIDLFDDYANGVEGAEEQLRELAGAKYLESIGATGDSPISEATDQALTYNDVLAKLNGANIAVGATFDASNLLGGIQMSQEAAQGLATYLASLGWIVTWTKGDLVDPELGIYEWTGNVMNVSGLGNTNSGGGGGGGGGEEPTKPKQDPFYNYIKTVDDYKKRLESLQDVQELLTKPIDIFNNTKAQEDYYKTLLGSNQSYLNHVNSELERLQKEAQSKYSKYIEVSIDGSLRLTEEYWASTGEITEELDEWIDAYDDVLGRQKDLTDEINDYKKELKDLWEGWRDGFIDLTNDIADVFQELDEKQLEDRQEFYEKLEEQDQRYLESVRNNIEEERKARERANSFEDLQKKQNRLALLQRDSSGRYANDIAELQEEINSDQQDLADQNVDNILDTLEKQMDKDAERHQDILDAMQKQIDSNVENRIYIERAEQTIAQGEQAILDAIHMGEDWRNASNAEREKMDEEQATNIAGSKSYLEKLNEGITSSSEYISKMVTDALTKQTESLIWTIGDIPQNDEVHVAHAMETTLPPILEQFFARTTTAQDMADDNATSGAKKYASGGLVDYTGPAWVDGTPGKPEAFLNANQTAMIAAFTANLAKMVSGKFPSSNIEAGSNCEINIDIGSIGADYDIDQAINKVKQEIVNSAQFRNVTLLNRRR